MMLDKPRLPFLKHAPRSTFRLLLLATITTVLLLVVTWRPRGLTYTEYEEYVKSVAARLKSAEQGRNKHNATEATSNATQPEPEPIKHCKDFRTRNDVLLIVKTGATEVAQKLPVHFKTTFTCPKDYLIFSDVEQEFQGVQIHDALDHMKDIVDKNTDEWRFKEQLENAKASSDPAREFAKLSGEEGWKLDKFKNLPMLLKSYKMFPDKKWYFFIDADTAIIWSNLLTWLSKFDHNHPYYMGSQTIIGDIEFGHGGSGYALSHAAAKALFDEDTDRKRKHHQYAMEVCCGDMLLSNALIDNGIRLYRSWPIIQGEEPVTVDFSEHHWNKPAITFHHMSPQGVEDVYYFEQHQRLLRKPPPTGRDVFEYFVAPHLKEDYRDGWDNNFDAAEIVPLRADSNEWDKIATRDFEGCREACLEKRDCMQFTFWSGHCSLSTVMRLGRKRKGRKAGWNLPRMQKWMEDRANKSIDWMLDFEKGQ